MSAVNSPNNKTYNTLIETKGKKTSITVTSPHNPYEKLVMFELPRGRIRHSSSPELSEDVQDALNHAAALAWARNAKAKKLAIIK